MLFARDQPLEGVDDELEPLGGPAEVRQQEGDEAVCEPIVVPHEQVEPDEEPAVEDLLQGTTRIVGPQQILSDPEHALVITRHGAAVDLAAVELHAMPRGALTEEER